MEEIRKAQIADIDGVLNLHRKYQIDTINEDDKKDGFVTSTFSKEQMRDLIENEEGLFIAVVNDTVVAYVMAASWQFWSPWPVQAYMADRLSEYEFKGEKLSLINSYQYGPICIDKSFRGTGLTEKIFAFALKEMSKRYSVLVTFINLINTRSFSAHTKKLGLSVLGEFQTNNNNYHWLACSTRV